MFDQVAEGSDAELKECPKWPEVPHWESQHAYTAELVGTDLVGHEVKAKLP